MNDVNIKVTLDSAQASGALRKLSKETDLFGRALKATAAYFGARELIRYTNSWTDLNSRLKNATGSTESANKALASIEATARRTYSSVDQTAETFLRNATVLNSLGVSTDNQIKLSEALNNALVVSGAKGERAASALNAMSRSLARGKVDTEAFTTILATAPEIVDTLTAATGKTTQELQKMASDGKLLSSVVVPALIGQLGNLTQKAEAMPTTIGDAFIVLDNAIGSLINKTDKQTGLTSILADGILFLADNLEQAAVAAGTFLGVMALGRLYKIRDAIIALNVAIAANPFGAAAVAIALLVSHAYSLLAPLDELKDAFGIKLLYVLENWFNAAVGGFTALVGVVGEAGSIIGDTLNRIFTLQDPRPAFANAGERMKKALNEGYQRGQIFDFLNEEDRKRINDVLEKQKQKAKEVGDAASNSNNIIRDTAEDATEKIKELTKALDGVAKSLETDVEQAYRKYQENLNAINEAEKNNVQSSISYGVLRLRNEEQLNEALQNIVQSNVDNYERAENEKTKKTEEETRKRLEFERGLGSIYGKIGDVGGLGQYDPLKAQYEEELKLLEEAKIRENQTEEEFEKRKAALKDYYRKLEQDKEKDHRNKLVQAILTGTASIPQLEEAMGKDRVKIAGQVGMELLNMAAQHNEKAFKMAKAINIALATADAITSTISAFKEGTKAGGPVLGFIYAGVVAAAQAAKIAQLKSVSYTGPRERGGPVGSGQSYLVGEAGPEIFTPNAGGTILPNDFQKEKPTQVIVEPKQETVNVNFSITTVDAQSFDNLLVQRRATITGIINNALNKRGRMGVT